MQRRELFGLMALGLAVAAAGCGAGDRPAASAVHDSAGITIVENPSQGTWTEGEAWTVSAEPAVDIGVLEGAEEYQLYQVRGAVRLSDGRIAVADGGTHEIRFYDPSGEYLRASGGQGEGPGEFQTIGSLLATPDDTLLVDDWRLSRVTVLDPAGDFVRTVRLESDARLPPRPVDVVGHDRLLARARSIIMPDEVESGVQRAPRHYLTYGMDGAPGDTIGEFPGSEGYLQMLDAGSIAFWTLPFARGFAIAADGDRVYVGVPDRYEVAVYTAAGALDRLVRKAHSPVPVTSDDVERFRQEQLARITNDNRRRDFESALADMPIHETMPAFGDIEVDATGHLWVEAYRAPGDERSRWSVFDPDGRLLGTVETPPGLGIYEIGADYILGHATDDFDVEHVRLHALARPVGGA